MRRNICWRDSDMSSELESEINGTEGYPMARATSRWISNAKSLLAVQSCWQNWDQADRPDSTGFTACSWESNLQIAEIIYFSYLKVISSFTARFGKWELIT